MKYQKPSQINPVRPVTKNAASQPYVAASQGTVAGAATAPMLVPEVRIPTASACSLRGNHSETLFTADGKLPDSEMPSRARITPKPSVLRTKACPHAAILHTSTQTP